MTIFAERALQKSPQLAADGQAAPLLRGRDRYLDSLLAIALVVIVTYHIFGWAWLPILFPSIGIMFARAGALVASALNGSPTSPWRVLKQRGIRILPPVWLLGATAVPIMLMVGWTHSQISGSSLTWRTMLFWVLPISDPPASTFGADWVGPVWFVRTCLWFLLVSPAFSWLFRHWPKRVLVIPFLVVLSSALGIFSLDGRSGDVILSVSIFGGCWMLGFAHHDEKIRSLPLAKVLSGGLSLMALGLLWAFTHQDPETSWDISNIPLADTLYSLGAVLALLRLHPALSWMDKHIVLSRLVSAISSRALTIYLWSNFAIFASSAVLHSWSLTSQMDQNMILGLTQKYVASWLALIVCVFLFGGARIWQNANA